MPSNSLLAIFLFSFIVGIGAVVSPGPVSASIVSESPRRGWLVGPLVATGHSLTELVLIVLIGLGLTAGIARPEIRTAISLIGGGLLLWMGLSYLWGVYRKRMSLPKPGEDFRPMTNWQMVGLGMVATVSNPFWYAWWATVVPGILLKAQITGLAALAAFYFGHISADYVWDTLLSGVVGAGRKWLTDRVYQGIILLCGGFMAYLGVVFILAGLK